MFFTLQMGVRSNKFGRPFFSFSIRKLLHIKYSYITKTEPLRYFSYRYSNDNPNLLAIDLLPLAGRHIVPFLKGFTEVIGILISTLYCGFLFNNTTFFEH